MHFVVFITDQGLELDPRVSERIRGKIIISDAGTTRGVWRAEKLSPDYPGLVGRELVPLEPQPATGVLSGGSSQD